MACINAPYQRRTQSSLADIIELPAVPTSNLQGLNIQSLLAPQKEHTRTPAYQVLLVRSSAILSLVPLVSAGSGFTSGPPMVSDMASAAAFFSRSASSALTSLPPTRSLVSFSSSLSPKLNGSLSPSPTGLGSTADSGCHLLCLLGVEALSPGPGWDD